MVGQLARHEVLDRRSGSKLRDWLEFDVREHSGTMTQWTRSENSPQQDSEYQPNRVVEIDYVLQRHQKDSWDGGVETKIVLEVRVAEAV